MRNKLTLASTEKLKSHALPLNPPHEQRRFNELSLLEATKQFEPCESPSSSCGNIQFELENYSAESGKYEGPLGDRFGSMVSAPYVLARLCASFSGLKIETCGQEAYKVTWEVAVKHKATGAVLTFYDYKGGISYGSDPVAGVLKGKAKLQFLLDVKNLLLALADIRFPHPYDNCAVGEEA